MVNGKMLLMLGGSVFCWVLVVAATATVDWSKTNPSGSCEETRGLWEACFDGAGCQQVTCQTIEDDDNLDAKERATRTFVILSCMLGAVGILCVGIMAFVEGSGCALTAIVVHVATRMRRALFTPACHARLHPRPPPPTPT